MRRILPAVIILIFYSCRSPQSLTPAEKQQVTDNVRQSLTNYHKAVEREGLNGEFRYLDSSADFFWVPPRSVSALSYDSVARFLRQNAAAYRKISIAWDTLRIIPLTKELAVYTGRVRSVFTDTSGNINISFLLETGTMIKREDGWKLLNGQTAMIGN